MVFPCALSTILPKSGRLWVAGSAPLLESSGTSRPPLVIVFGLSEGKGSNQNYIYYRIRDSFRRIVSEVKAYKLYHAIVDRMERNGSRRYLLHRRLQPFRYLHDCSGCFRLERSPGGACTHWRAPPCHGAHVKRTLRRSARGPSVCVHYLAKAAERIAVKVVVGVIASGSIFTWIIEGNSEARVR